MKLLHIDSSITGANSASRQLSAALVAALKAAIPGLEVIRRDLDANPIPHLDSKRLPTVRPGNAQQGRSGSQTRVATTCSTSSSAPTSSSSARRRPTTCVESGATMREQSAGYYRTQAERLRLEAYLAEHESVRRQLIAVAADYEELPKRSSWSRSTCTQVAS